MFRVAFVAVLISMALSGCLVDGVDKASPQGGGGDVIPDTHFVVQGRALKGVLRDAVVNIHPFISGVPAETPLTSTVTDAEGYYSLRIPKQYLGAPALISVALQGAVMRCDLVQGCGGWAFGHDVPVENTAFALYSGVPELQSAGIYHVTAMTHLAYALAQTEVAASANGVANMNVRLRLLSANSRVANRLGIIGELLSLNPVDITSDREVEDAAAMDLYYSLLNSALVESAQNAYGDSGVWQPLAQLTTHFAEEGIAGRSTGGSGRVTLAAVLERMTAAYTHLQQRTGRDYSNALSELAMQRGLVLSEPVGEPTQGEPSSTASLTALEKAKKLVSGVRQIASSMDLSKLVVLSSSSQLFSGEILSALEGFGVTVDTSALLDGDSPTYVMSATGKVGMTILEAIMAHYRDGFVPREIAGVSVEHRFSQGRHTISVLDVIDVCEEQANACPVAVDLQAIVNITSFGGNVSESALILRGVNGSISGRLTHEAYELSVESASRITVDRFLAVLGQGDEEGKTLLELDRLDVQLPLAITSFSNNNTVALQGYLGASLEGLMTIFETHDSQIPLPYGHMEQISATDLDLYRLSRLKVSFHGAIDTNQGDIFYASFNVMQSARPFEGEVRYSSVSRRLCNPVCGDVEESSDLQGESPENFIGLSASAGFKAHLRGIREPALVQISGARESPTDNVINNMNVSYPGNAFSLNGRFNNNGGIVFLDAKNLDGMRVNIDTQVNGRRHGGVQTQTGKKVADVIDMGQWIKIEYINGQFESL